MRSLVMILFLSSLAVTQAFGSDVKDVYGDWELKCQEDSPHYKTLNFNITEKSIIVTIDPRVSYLNS